MHVVSFVLLTLKWHFTTQCCTADNSLYTNWPTLGTIWYWYW